MGVNQFKHTILGIKMKQSACVILGCTLALLVGCNSGGDKPKTSKEQEHLNSLTRKFDLRTNGDDMTLVIPSTKWSTDYGVMHLSCRHGESTIEYRIYDHHAEINVAGNEFHVNISGSNNTFTASGSKQTLVLNHARSVIEHIIDRSTTRDLIGATVVYSIPTRYFSIHNLNMDVGGLHELVDSMPINSCNW